MAIAPELITTAQRPKRRLDKRIVQVLQERFSQSTVSLYKNVWPQIAGNIIWDGFEGMSFEGRGDMVWGTLHNHFPDELENKVVVFYTFTSFENPDKEDNLF